MSFAKLACSAAWMLGSSPRSSAPSAGARWPSRRGARPAASPPDRRLRESAPETTGLGFGELAVLEGRDVVADAADAVLGSGDGVGKAQLDGFHVRVLSSAATTARRHMYQTAWHEACGDSSAGAGAILLLGSTSNPAVQHLDSAPQLLLASVRPIFVVAATESLLPLPALAMALRLVSSMTGSPVAPPTMWL